MAISRGKNYMTTMIIKHDKYKEVTLDQLCESAHLWLSVGMSLYMSVYV